MNIEIKKAKIDDLDSINNLLRLSKSYWGYDEEFINKFMKKLCLTAEHLKETTTLIFYVDGKMAGFYGFLIDKDGTLELENLFLHPDYIGKNIGRKLWETCCDTAKSMGKSEFIIWSDPNAENFYIKMGCKKIGERKSPIMPGRYPRF